MFFDSNAWPPAPDGRGPPPRPKLTRAQEDHLLRMIGWFVLVMVVGPFAGSSVIAAVMALLGSGGG
ncbi:hypothetical protein [Sphingomonas radiodurans]|uniref:hypothetical protein n=1 Tax=Sphingomonas radiodurans TaxID=2890321 RepID=UPI001E4C4321|nr:hypothetical protein [Sphingomonas radiodurans]WBH17471.1 hypothetical protein LLW23_05020 [Sphingomonas radiodurans]